MNYFLAKTDPETYSIDDLQKDKKTIWDGVHNYAAINYIKKMKKDDLMLIYHSQGKAAIVGIAKIISDSYENKKDERFSWVVEVEFLKKFKDDEFITLKEIKESHLFDDWSLIKQSRLSTMSVPEEFIKWGKISKLLK